MNVLIINGPNLNMLGYRNPEIYGNTSYQNLEDLIRDYASDRQIDISFFQSNHEGDIIDRIQKACIDGCDGIVINAGAYAHYSYAIRDALEMCEFPKVEVHISNVMEREQFRHNLVLSEVCNRTIFGEGIKGYLLAIDFLLDNHHNI